MEIDEEEAADSSIENLSMKINSFGWTKINNYSIINLSLILSISIQQLIILNAHHADDT